VTLDERIALEFGERLAVFVGLAIPHAARRPAADMSEALDDFRVLLKMNV